jgi:hypothetical protein
MQVAPPRDVPDHDGPLDTGEAIAMPGPCAIAEPSGHLLWSAQELADIEHIQPLFPPAQ